MKTLKKYILDNLSAAWLAILAAAGAVFLISVLSGVLIEDMQGLLFPVLLVIVWRLPRFPQLRMPVPYVALACVTWLGLMAFNIHSEKDAKSEVFVSRLAGDEQGLSARALVQRYNEIARTYHMPEAALVNRALRGDDALAQWLDRQRRSPFVIGGQPSWLRVVVPRDKTMLSDMFLPPLGSEEKARFSTEAAKFSLVTGTEVVPFQPAFSSFTLGITVVPEAFEVPGAPQDLALHFLAWLAGALDPMPKDPGNAAEAAGVWAKRRSDLVQAADVLGPWKTQSPLGFANCMLATLDLVEAGRDRALRKERIDAIVQRFGKGAAMSGKNEAPEIYAACLNNAGVLAALTGDPGQLKTARRWFLAASKADSQAGGPVRGAKAGLLNLYLLDLNGL